MNLFSRLLRIVERLEDQQREVIVVSMTHSSAQPKLLLIEDDPQLADLLIRVLSVAQFEVAWEPSGAAAVERILTTQPQLVILDLMLPGVSGLEVCRAARAGYRGSIMMLTASQSALDQQEQS